VENLEAYAVVLVHSTVQLLCPFLYFYVDEEYNASILEVTIEAH
jgi:hypothetical protein